MVGFLKKHRRLLTPTFVISFFILFFIVAGSFLAPILAPYDPEEMDLVNNQYMECHFGFSVYFANLCHHGGYWKRYYSRNYCFGNRIYTNDFQIDQVFNHGGKK